jgi:hypothetical protein
VNALKWLRLATGPTSRPEVKSLADVGSASFKEHVQAVLSTDRTFRILFSPSERGDPGAGFR